MTDTALTTARARADQELAHVNTTLDGMVDYVRRDLRDAAATDVWVRYADMVDRVGRPEFAAEMLAAALLRLAGAETSAEEERA